MWNITYIISSLVLWCKGEIKKLERIKWRATKMVRELEHMK